MLLGIAAVAMIILALLTRQWLSIAVFAAMGVALGIYGQRPPEVLDYRLSEKGLTVKHKFYPYDQFRSFSVAPDVSWHVIELEPTRRFMPRLTVMFDNDHFEQIVAILSQHLPRVDRQADWIERLSRRLKF